MAEGSPCVASRPGYGWACRLATTDAGRRWLLDAGASLGPLPPSPASAPAAAPARVPLAEGLRVLGLVRACPHRRKSTTCGCVTCALDGRTKGFRECSACVTADPRPSGDAA